MEDTSIHINNFPTNNHYLFGVFDGHGGNLIFIKGLKLLSMLKYTFPFSSMSTKNFSKNIMNKL
jgi:serine/threonine protein phosphatase PrpC